MFPIQGGFWYYQWLKILLMPHNFKTYSPVYNIFDYVDLKKPIVKYLLRWLNRLLLLVEIFFIIECRLRRLPFFFVLKSHTRRMTLTGLKTCSFIRYTVKKVFSLVFNLFEKRKQGSLLAHLSEEFPSNWSKIPTKVAVL